MQTILVEHLGRGVFKFPNGKYKCLPIRAYIYDIPIGKIFILLSNDTVCEWVNA